MGVCLRVLRESNKSRFDSYSVRNIVLIISHITFRDCRVDTFSDNLSRNSYLFLLAFLDLTVHNVRQHSYRFEFTDQQKHRINLFSHSFLSREHMNPQLTCSQQQQLRSSVGRASHRYREVTGSNPVEVLNFFQASSRNCINCVHCDDHFFIFISFPQFIYDLFHISLTKNKELCTVRELPT